MVDSTKITTVARLRDLLATMERDLGLESISSNELDILYVVRLLCDESSVDTAETADIRNHKIVVGMSQPTFNRALRSLIDKGYLEPAPNYKTRHYRLGPKTAEA